MATIKITSKLTPNQSQRLRRRATLHAERETGYSLGFIHPGTNAYSPLWEPDPHDVARHMMVVAGTTFDYEVN